MIEVLILGYLQAKGLTPKNSLTLENQDSFGRLDVLASSTIAELASYNPAAQLAHSLLRPAIDAILHQNIGPQRAFKELTKFLPAHEAAQVMIGSAQYVSELKANYIPTSKKTKKKSSKKKVVKPLTGSASLGTGKGDYMDLELQKDGTYA